MVIHLLSVGAALLYLAAAVGYVRLVQSDGERSRLSTGVLALGFLLHALFIATQYYFRVPGISLPRVPHALSVLSFALVAAYLPAERWLLKGHALGMFLVPIVAVLMLLSAACYHLSGAASPVDAPGWLVSLHLMFVLAGYLLFVLALAVNVALVAQESRLKRKAPIRLKERLPSIVTLDRLNRSLLAVGLLLLITGVLVGAIIARSEPLVLLRDPRIAWSLITIFVYGVLVAALTVGGVRGRKAVWLSLVGFVTIVGSFLGGGFRSGNFHVDGRIPEDARP